MPAKPDVPIICGLSCLASALVVSVAGYSANPGYSAGSVIAAAEAFRLAPGVTKRP